MGLNVSYRHFGNQAAAAEDARREGGGAHRKGRRDRERTGHLRPIAMVT